MNKKTTLIIVSVILVIAILAVAGLFFAMQKQNPTPVVENSNPAEVQTTTIPENEETASSSPANSSLASATAPGLSSCVVLDEKYCNKGSAALYPTDNSIPPELNGKIYGAEFKLQEKIKIYSPFDGVAQDVMYIDENGKEVKMIIVMALPVTDLSNVLEVSFVNVDLESSLKKEISTNGPKKMIIYKDSLKKTDENIVGGGVKVSKGELIGTINDLSFVRNSCNLIISFFNKNLTASSRPAINIEKLKEYFSYIK